MEDSPRKMIRSAASFFSGTMLSRVTGLLRDIAMAFAFGTEASLAAFFVAFRFAHLLRRLLGESSLQTAFVPGFEALRKESKSTDRSLRFFIDLYAALSLILLLVIGVGTAVGLSFDHFFRDVWSSGTMEILTLSLLMLPSLFFICLAGLHTAYLQCERSYFLPAAAPVAFNLLWIFGVLFLASVPPQEAMPKLALCIVVACFFQWLVTLPKVTQLLIRDGLNFNHFSTINPFSNDICSMWKPLVLGIVGIGAAQINSAFDAIFARFAESSGPAYLWYAIRLQQLPLALFGIALSGALLPPLTRAIKEGDLTRSSKLLDVAVHRSMLLIVPITAGLFILGYRCIDLLYGYGDFNVQSVAGTTDCLWGYSLGLIPMTLVLITAPIYYARADYRTPTIASVMSMILNMALNVLFVLKLNLNASSIALATSLCAWVNLAYLIVAMDSTAQEVFLQSIRKIFQETGKALLLTCAIVWPASSFMPSGDSFFTKCLYFGILGLLFVILFGISSFFLMPRKKLEENINKP